MQQLHNITQSSTKLSLSLSLSLTVHSMQWSLVEGQKLSTMQDHSLHNKNTYCNYPKMKKFRNVDISKSGHQRRNYGLSWKLGRVLLHHSVTTVNAFSSYLSPYLPFRMTYMYMYIMRKNCECYIQHGERVWHKVARHKGINLEEHVVLYIDLVLGILNTLIVTFNTLSLAMTILN